MADAKKPDKGKAAGGKSAGGKPASGGEKMSLEAILLAIAFIAVLVFGVVVPTLFKAWGVSNGSIFPPHLVEDVTAAFESFVTTSSYISIFISLIFICGIIYAKVMYAEFKKKHQEAFVPTKTFDPLGDDGSAEGSGQFQKAGPDPRWADIQSLMQSGNAADWRIAILEADIMLEDMLTQMGYPGESIGDKLKAVDQAHFATLQDAWRAHKVRNTIAHEGASFKLSRSEAENTILQFKKVFDEFYFI